MATKKKAAKAAPVNTEAKNEPDKGYAGTDDYLTGKVAPGGQMSVQQIREFNRDKR